jgi:hypothetical protein
VPDCIFQPVLQLTFPHTPDALANIAERTGLKRPRCPPRDGRFFNTDHACCSISYQTWPLLIYVGCVQLEQYAERGRKTWFCPVVQVVVVRVDDDYCLRCQFHCRAFIKSKGSGSYTQFACVVGNLSAMRPLQQALHIEGTDSACCCRYVPYTVVPNAMTKGWLVHSQSRSVFQVLHSTKDVLSRDLNIAVRSLISRVTQCLCRDTDHSLGNDQNLER